MTVSSPITYSSIKPCSRCSAKLALGLVAFRPYYAGEEHAGLFVLDPSLGFPEDICMFPRAGYNGHYKQSCSPVTSTYFTTTKTLQRTVVLPQLYPHLLYDWVVAPCTNSWVVSKDDRGLSGHAKSVSHFQSAENQAGSASWVHPATMDIMILRRAG